LSGDPRRFLAVLAIATPCPLLLAIPVAILGSCDFGGGAARHRAEGRPSALEHLDRCQNGDFR
jgi:cation transport ATPase